MIKKILTLLLLFTSILYVVSQEKYTLISGKITDSIGVVKNANIINLKTNQGTSSNNNGEFRIFVRLNDSLRISSIQHIPRIISIKKKHLEQKEILVSLKSNIYQLDEFELKRHDLSGRLGIDSKNVPIDKKDSILRGVLDFSKIDFKSNFPIDNIQRMKPPMVSTVPNSFGGGAGVGVPIPFKDSERLWALRRKLARKKAFPFKILSELGTDFFFDKLKIPVDKYFHFLEYCNPLGIENLHKEGKSLELIKILREESVTYIKIIKKE